MAWLQNWKVKTRSLYREVFVLYNVIRDPRVPWYARGFIFIVVAYALSPIDIVPDFIPVVGYLDDLILIPIGIYLAVKMIPKNVIEEYRQALENTTVSRKTGWSAAVVIMMIWLATAYWIYRMFTG